MKGDRMPTILSPLANAMGEEYTDTWFDFLLDPIKLNNHLQELCIGKSNHPNVSSIIKTLLKQYEKYIIQQQQQQKEKESSSTDSSTTTTSTSTSTSTTTSTTSSTTNATTPLSSSSGSIITTSTITISTSTLKRSKLIIDLVINVITHLKFSLDDFEKNIPIKHQRVILEQLETKNDIDIEYQTFLNRWILRGIIKGTPIKYLLSNYSSSPSSPNLVSTNTNTTTNTPTSSSLLNVPMTPPSTPPPTPPSFISLATTTGTSTTGSSSTNKDSSNNIQDTNQSLEELFYKSNLLLNEWINDNYDSDKPSDSDRVVPILLFELGEFQFYKENFYDARKLFDKAYNIINLPHINEIIQQQTTVSTTTTTKSNSNNNNIVGNKLQQLSNYKEKIQSLIIACKTIDLYDIGENQQQQQQSMDTSTSTTTPILESYENNKNFQIEKALASNDIDKVITILNSDIIDFNKSTSLDFTFRLNLEFNILPSKLSTTTTNNNNKTPLPLLNIHFGNLLKSTIIQYKYNNYSLDEFKYMNKESIQLFFSLVELVLNKAVASTTATNKIEFLLFKIYNLIISDYKLETNSGERYFIEFLKKSLPLIYKKFNKDNQKEEEEECNINISSNGSSSSSSDVNNEENKLLLLNNFIKELDPIKINKLLESLSTTTAENNQKNNLILYQKSLDLFEIGNLKSSTTILVDYLGGNSNGGIGDKVSSNSVDYQLFLYDLLLKNYKNNSGGGGGGGGGGGNNSGGGGKIKTNSILSESFKSLVSKHGPPSEFIAERILSTLINRSKWKSVKSISNILSSSSSPSTLSSSFSELLYISNFLASIGKLIDNENKEKKLLNKSNNNNSMVVDSISKSVSSSEENKESKSSGVGGDDNKNNNESDRDDSDMDIDDDDNNSKPTVTSNTVPSSSTTSTTNKLNSNYEEIYIGFLSSILPRYEQKSIHWTFIKSNNFYNRNSNQIAGILNLLEKKSLYNRIIYIFVGLIHSIQIYKKVQNDLNLDLYNNNVSNQISNTIIFPNKHFSVEIEPLLLNVYLDTLNKMNNLYGVKIDSQKKLQQQQQQQQQLNTGSSEIFNNGRNLIYIGDIYFEKKYHKESLRYYLLGCALENAFFSDSLKTSISNVKYLSFLSRRLFDCFYFLRAPMQAIVVSQFFSNLNQTCLVSFKIIQEEYYQLDPNYFQYIWEIPLLEILLNTFSKQKDIKKVYLLNQILSNPNINENNHPDIRKNFIKNTKHNFWKAITNNYLL